MNEHPGGVARHLEHLRARNLRPSTIDARRNVLGRLRRWAGVELLDVTHDQLVDFLGRPTIGPEARAMEVTHLRGFYRWAVEEELIDRDPTVRLRRPKLPRRLPRPIGEPDLVHALDQADTRVRPWLLLAGWAGLRCCEIASLSAEDFWWEARVILLRDSKGGDQQRVQLSRWLVDELRRCDLPTHGRLFMRTDGTAPLKAHNISSIGNRHLRSCGIDATMHQLRHRFGTQAHRATRDIRKTQELMRHQSLNSTQIYTWVDQADLAEAVDLIPRADTSPRLFTDDANEEGAA